MAAVNSARSTAIAIYLLSSFVAGSPLLITRFSDDPQQTLAPFIPGDWRHAHAQFGARTRERKMNPKITIFGQGGSSGDLSSTRVAVPKKMPFSPSKSLSISL